MREKCKQRTKKYRENNYEKSLESVRKSHEKNKEKNYAKAKEYYEEHKEQIKARRSEKVKCDICEQEISRGSITRHKTRYHKQE